MAFGSAIQVVQAMQYPCVKIIASTIWEAAVLVLQMGGNY
jgi:hypothetical protein